MRHRGWGSASAVVVAVAAACGSSSGRPDAADGGDDAAPDAPPVTVGHRVLFVGNSYVYTNDVPAHYRAAVAPGVEDVRTEQAAPGGYTLEQHADDAATDGTDLARWLRTGTDAERDFDAVILQEQSQIGGYPYADDYTPIRFASLTAAAALGARAAGGGARVVLYMTWGREHGDPDTPMMFDDFVQMQDHLDHGYKLMAEYLRAQGVADVRIAPVGAGFRAVFDAVTAAGDDPLVEGTDFDALYEPDGSHPSPQGAYLAGCILAATAADADPAAVPDDPALGAAVSARLRDACATAVADPRWRGLPQLVQQPVPFTALRADAGLRSPSYLLAVGDDGDRFLVTPSQGELRAIVRGDAGWDTEAVLPIPTTLTAYITGLALSGDATRALAGVPGLDAHAGAVHAYHRDASGWHVDGPLVLAGAPTFVGRAVAISRDGAVAVVATLDDVRSFTATADGWSEAGAIPHVASGVALDATGHRAALATTTGHAIYLRDAATGAWTLEGTVDADFGPRDLSVRMDDAGDRFAVLGSDHTVNSLAVVYVRAGSTWGIEGDTGPVPDGSYMLPPLAMDATGTRIILGTPTRRVPLGQGAARVFTRAGDTGWHEEYLLVPPDLFDVMIGYRFGVACAIARATDVAMCAQPGLVGVATSYHGVRSFQLPALIP